MVNSEPNMVLPVQDMVHLENRWNNVLQHLLKPQNCIVREQTSPLLENFIILLLSSSLAKSNKSNRSAFKISYNGRYFFLPIVLQLIHI